MKENSDQQDQGFVPNKIQIKHKTPKLISKTPNTPRKQDFNQISMQPKILIGDILLWKQPPQANISVQQLQINLQQQQSKKKKIKKNLVTQHPYHKYTISSQYKLIYTRKKVQPFQSNQNNLAKNQIILTSFGLTESVHLFRKIKEFSLKKTQTTNLDTQQLQIDSKFQCGNAYCAYKLLSQQEYHLFIQNDTNTYGYNQWFYFSVKNIKKEINYRFKIMNFKKKHSFFKFGYKPAIFSLKKKTWYRGGNNIVYQESPISDSNNNVKYYCLSFQIDFENQNDFVLIAMNIPYSYTKMIKKVYELKEKAIEKNYDIKIEINQTRTSLAGNSVPQISITKNINAKKAIIITARQHPGQTWSSYMMQGFLKQLLTQKSDINQWLLQNFRFIIYPMINVDGVIYGNSRCDISGMDLNRRWKEPSPNFHPQIYQIKKRIAQYSKKFDIKCCLDLHGHSKSYNIFCYSCKTNMYSCRLLPYLIQSINPIFYFPSCTFGISKYKETTARATIYRQIKNQNVLTIESSYFGFKQNGKMFHFQPKHLYSMAKNILQAIKQFCDIKSTKRSELEAQIKANISSLLKYQELIDLDSGSDSEPQIDEIDFKEKVQKIFPKRFISQQIYFQKPSKRSIRLKRKINNDIKESSSEQQENIQKQLKLSAKTYKGKQDNDDKIRQNATIKQQKSQKVVVIASKRKKIVSRPLNLKNTIQMKKDKNQQDKGKYDSQSLSVQKRKLSQSRPRSFLSRKKVIAISNNMGKLNNTNNNNNNNNNNSRQQTILQAFEAKKQSRSVDSNAESQFIKKIRYQGPQRNLRATQINSIQQSIYNQDQNQLLGVLFRNKRMLQLQRIKRNLQKSNSKNERELVNRVYGGKKQSIVDYRRFKINQKVNIQIKRMLDKSARYNGDFQNYQSLHH